MNTNISSRNRTVRRGVFAFLLTLVLLFAAVPILTSKPVYECGVRSVLVQHGDTLDGIVREHCHGDTNEVVHLLARMYGTLIQVGDTIHLPVKSG